MDHILAFSITVFTGFFAITNPISNMTIFMSLVGDAEEQEKRIISKKAAFVAFIIGLVFIILGKTIFQLFGITVPAFKITGGILIFYVGFEMLQSKKSNVKHLGKTNVDENIAISPLAIPIIAGPGTIVTAMNFVANANYFKIGIVVLIFAFMCYLNYVAFNLSDFIVRKLGRNVISVIGKIMGLIIAIIGTSMIIQGIKISFNLP
ncbi:MarC family protein [Flavobacteriaceae bacterium GSB9]|nr:MarC family protein [Flavobacteriaceae bacterium GSB9]